MNKKNLFKYIFMSVGNHKEDLINEPCFREDMNDQFSKKSAVPGDIYRKVVKGCLDVIHKQNPKRLVVADGNNGGGLVTPELNDLKVGQSCRGYHPGDSFS